MPNNPDKKIPQHNSATQLCQQRSTVRKLLHLKTSLRQILHNIAPDLGKKWTTLKFVDNQYLEMTAIFIRYFWMNMLIFYRENTINTQKQRLSLLSIHRYPLLHSAIR